MQKWQTHVVVALALGGMLAAAPDAESSLIEITSGTFSGSTDLIQFQEFDPALGTLDSVHVSIQGTLRVQGQSALNPSAFPYFLVVEQDFFPGAFGRGFEFVAPPAVFTVGGVATGAGEVVVHAGFFSYSFSFTPASDLLGGFTFPSFSSTLPMTPPGGVHALRGDFLPSSPPLTGLFPIETIMMLATSQTSGVPFPSLSASAEGSVIVEYRYTPEPAAAPEPATSGSLALALLTLAALRRRPVSQP